MEKQEAITEFLRGFKALLNISTLYTKNHPYFLKPSQELKDKIEALFQFLSPIALGFSPSTVKLDGKEYSKEVFASGIAQFLHGRKIKALEFKKGVEAQELVAFMGAVSLRPKELFKAGGIAHLLLQEGVTHVGVEELEYSHLLAGQGEEVKDVWAYLLDDTIKSANPQKINELADAFPATIRKFKADDFIKDPQLRKGLATFMEYLKEHKIDKYKECNQAMLKSVLFEKGIDQEAHIEELKALLRDFTPEDFANALAEEFTRGSGADSFNVKLFSAVLDEKGHKETAATLKEKLARSRYTKDNPLVFKKLTDLFSMPSDSTVSETYRNIMVSLTQGAPSREEFHFDRTLLQANYSYILLNLLYEEKAHKRMSPVLEKISKGWKGMAEQKDWHYFKSLIEVLSVKKNQDHAVDSLCLVLEQEIRDFIEESILQGEEIAEQEYFINYLQTSSKKAEYYVNKIFKEGNTSPPVLNLFFKLFPAQYEIFYAALKQRIADMVFLEGMIGGLAQVEGKIALGVYIQIFDSVNEIIKIDILEAMQKLSVYDEGFLLPVIEKGSLDLKKEAFRILQGNDAARIKVSGMFTAIFPGWGKKNKVVAQNLDAIQELGLVEAKPYVLALSKTHFFWNRKIRKRAREVLRKIE